MPELEEFLAAHAFLLPNLNDTFAYACADSEQITVGDGEHMARFWRDYGWHGLVAIAAVKRDRYPLAEVALSPKYKMALGELLAAEWVDPEWTLLDEFELHVGPNLSPAPTAPEHQDGKR